MNESDFATAAFQSQHRPKLLQAMQVDPALLQKARDRVAALELAQQRGRIFDRDAISRMTHETLTRLIAQVDAARSQEPEVKVT